MATKVTVEEDKPEAPKDNSEEVVKEALTKVTEAEKLKSDNDKLEAEIKRSQELRAAAEKLGGRSYAGEPLVDSPEERAKKEASEILGRVG